MAIVTGQGNMTTSVNQTVTSGLVSTQQLTATVTTTSQYGNGTGAKQVNLVHAKQYTLAGSATTLTLSSIADMAGATVNFARVREFAVQVVSTMAGYDVIVGAAASNAWKPFWGMTGYEVVHAGTTSYKSDPLSVGGTTGAVVTASSSDQVKLDPGANTVVVNVFIAGCDATS